MKGKGVSRDYSRSRTRCGMKTVKSCKAQGDLDDIVLIDVDSDEFENIIIIDVPESLQKKLKGSSVLREGKRFPCIISIDDDEDEGDIAEQPEINAEIDGNLDSDGTSSQSSPASGHNKKSVHRDGDDFQVSEENRPAFKLRKCNRTYAEKAPSGNHYGLYSDSESDWSEDSTSDCEVMDDEFGELREQWEKASLKRKSKVCEGSSGPEDQASPCSSQADVHPNVEPENRTNQTEPFVCSNSENVNFEKMNSCASAAPGDGSVGGFFSSTDMENPFAKSNDKEFTHVPSNTRPSKDRAVPSSSCAGIHPNVAVENRTNQTEPSVCSSSEGVNFEKMNCCASTAPVDGFVGGFSFAADVENLFAENKDEGFIHVLASSYSNEPQRREKFVSNARSSKDEVVENVVDPSRTTSEAGHEESCLKMDEAAHRGESLQCHDTLDKLGTSKSAEGKEIFTDILSSDQLHNERHLLCAPHGNLLCSAENDIIIDREKLKETDEYKQAIEEEWAARQQQLRIQAEEARRLRKRRKAETLRILDMEKRQKQRVEEVRKTQKKDEENLNMKERFRAEVRNDLSRLEVRCTNMASLLHGLGIHVDGGSQPLSHQVHAAYKRALLRFHPDRASRTDMRQQVEAEEKFKLISRMKEKFLSAS